MGQFLAFITGVVTVLLFVIKVRDAFPEHKDSRKTTLLLALGIFIGSVLGSINSVDIKLETVFHPVGLLLVIFLSLIITGIVIISSIAVSSNDYQKRNELYGLITGGVVLFFTTLIATCITLKVLNQNSNDPLSNKEIVHLASFYLQNSDYETALKYLERLEIKYHIEDPRRKKIEIKIKTIKEQMANSTISDFEENFDGNNKW